MPLRIHPRALRARAHTTRTACGFLKFAQPERVARNPDDALRLDACGVRKVLIRHRVVVWATDGVTLDVRLVRSLGVAVLGDPERSSLVSKAERNGTDERAKGVIQREVKEYLGACVNITAFPGWSIVSYRDYNEDDHEDAFWDCADATVLVPREEEQGGQADLLQVQSDKDVVNGLGVEKASRVARVGLV